MMFPKPRLLPKETHVSYVYDFPGSYMVSGEPYKVFHGQRVYGKEGICVVQPLDHGSWHLCITVTDENDGAVHIYNGVWEKFSHTLILFLGESVEPVKVFAVKQGSNAKAEIVKIVGPLIEQYGGATMEEFFATMSQDTKWMKL